ncbi:hypothetical protein UlMin_022466 [Ulmus minor]
MTILHFVASSPEALFLLKKMLQKLPPESLSELKTMDGDTPLTSAVMSGNLEAAKLLVSKNPDLPNIWDNDNRLPLHYAANKGHKEMTLFLLSKTSDNNPSPDGRHPSLFDQDCGLQLLADLIQANLFGITLDLVKTRPKLACASISRQAILFQPLFIKYRELVALSHLGPLERIIYDCICVAVTEDDDIPLLHNSGGDDDIPLLHNSGGDDENLIKATKYHFDFGMLYKRISSTFGKVPQKIWDVLKYLDPRFKQIHDMKLTHMQMIELVKLMLAKVPWGSKASSLVKQSFLAAMKSGFYELVYEMIMTCPNLVHHNNQDGRNVFQLAALYRQDKILKLMLKMGNYKKVEKKGIDPFEIRLEWGKIDKFGNTILHLAAMLQPSSQISGAALRMQRELQWFRAVEEFVHPSLHEKRNAENLTPRELFTKEHRKLVKEGEEWMKTTAEFCTVVATLIATMVFGAAFTVPGGNNDQGFPIFLHKTSFLIFAISDALALFFSSTSVLMFLGILTARYAEEDFLKSLPRKLCYGLIFLFFSLVFLMAAFSSGLYIVLFKRLEWVAIPIAALAFLTLLTYAFWQFPLIVEIYYSTYRYNISLGD